MSAFRLAFSFILIPRLFLTLFFFPLLLSLILVYIQLVITGVVIRTSDRSPVAIENQFNNFKENNLVRQILFGSGAPLKRFKTCRWIEKPGPDKELFELPPDKSCAPDRLDVAVRASNPALFDATAYEEIFRGNTERLHICKSCRPDVVITPAGINRGANTEIFSLQGFMLLSLLHLNDTVTESYIEAAKTYDATVRLIGERKFYAPGFREAISFKGISTQFALIGSIAVLVVITLWLAIKAHRKVLDYFARSGALLPMVAATGKRVFYSAIWLLTLFRVIAFLAASVPMTIFSFREIARAEHLDLFVGKDLSLFLLWILAIVASLGLAAIIASVGDLKQRHSWVSFTYHYLPLGISAIGIAVWAFTFLFDSNFAATFRDIVIATPVFGMAPVILAPVFKPTVPILIVHTSVSLLAALAILRHNAHWFAAHLEDL
jgi:hypothetical protein